MAEDIASVSASAMKKRKHELKLSHREWQGWLCVCADMYMDGFALVAALGTSAEARKLKEYLKKAHEAATSFEQANCFLQCSLKEDTMNLPGFGAEDGPLVGEIVLHNFGSEKVGKNFHRVHSKYLLQNPGRATTESYKRWCSLHAMSQEDSSSLSKALVHLNQHLCPDVGFDALQRLIGVQIPKIAPPTELVVMNPYVPWESQTVSCTCSWVFYGDTFHHLIPPEFWLKSWTFTFA